MALNIFCTPTKRDIFNLGGMTVHVDDYCKSLIAIKDFLTNEIPLVVFRTKIWQSERYETSGESKARIQEFSNRGNEVGRIGRRCKKDSEVYIQEEVETSGRATLGEGIDLIDPINIDVLETTQFYGNN